MWQVGSSISGSISSTSSKAMTDYELHALLGTLAAARAATAAAGAIRSASAGIISSGIDGSSAGSQCTHTHTQWQGVAVAGESERAALACITATAHTRHC